MAQDQATVVWQLDELMPSPSPIFDGMRLPVAMGPNLTIAKGQLLARRTADGLYYPYATGATDGTQNPSCICPRQVATDATGQITFGAVAGGGWYGETWSTVTCYFKGHFEVTQLVGLDAAALTRMGARVVDGDAVGFTSGIFIF